MQRQRSWKKERAATAFHIPDCKNKDRKCAENGTAQRGLE
jgi:hypothetical protein